MTAPIRLVLIGASGRMGRSILRALPGFPQFELAAAIVSPGSSTLGLSCEELAGTAPGGNVQPGALRTTADLAAGLAGAGLAIDFSGAAAVAANVSACTEARVPLLLGTTGYAQSLKPALELAATRIPLLVAANTSLGVTVLLELVRRAARDLPAGFDIEISEAHHRDKIDAPSGTALALGAVARAARGAGPEGLPSIRGTGSHGSRGAGDIGYAVTRGGDLVGEHAVHFIGAGERLSLSHVATDRAIFARGALSAGAWLARQGPGAYRMGDAVGEK